MNHVYLIRFVVLKRPGFQLQKYGMSIYDVTQRSPKSVPRRVPIMPASLPRNV